MQDFFYLPGLRLFHLAAGLLSRWRLPPGESSNLSLKKWLVEILRGGLPPGEAGGGWETNIQNKVRLTTLLFSHLLLLLLKSFISWSTDCKTSCRCRLYSKNVLPLALKMTKENLPSCFVSGCNNIDPMTGKSYEQSPATSPLSSHIADDQNNSSSALPTSAIAPHSSATSQFSSFIILPSHSLFVLFSVSSLILYK